MSGGSTLLDKAIIQSYHNGNSFTTIDKDNDKNAGNCASLFKGGWWFDSCYYFCLTCEGSVGQYIPTTCGNDYCYIYSEHLKMSTIPSTL